MFAITGYAPPRGFRGLGQDNTEPVATPGIFDNITAAFGSLSVTDWAILLGGAFLLFSLLYTTGRGVSATRTTLRNRRQKASRRAKLEQQLRDL